jgi:hypothetical protein
VIAELIDRLEAAGSDYETIDHAWSLDETLDQIREPMPVALFIPGPVDTEPSPSLPIRQRSTESIVVITICNWEDLEGLRNQLTGAMLGYQHAPGYTDLEHKKGEVRRIAGQVVQWMDLFTASRWITAATLPYPAPEPEPEPGP